ncbi:KdsC family phosphatase [Lederbergia citrea]|uniref:HAD-IIIA family hydrolase n=1 Tax=Lederbergia citrea TaxID=2833581 RepID=A0A942Z5H3_9BACI|nr:HAD-IIIA family hydrolase [Lederbergia citrea]MBS4205792.1 HAD-IIIA family hydrolase [Lederbergia citrea]MBS4224759.1 HAD-IIIA family hydrolase [Lederbergia citrea]
MKKAEIKLIVLDVDGVLTDGKLLIGSNGAEYKSFHVKDGMGISLARYHGIKIAIITGRKSESVNIRSKELNVDFIFQGITNKEEALNEIVTSLNMNLQNVFYMGDDINDLSVIKLVGFSSAPSDAADIVKKSVNFVSNFTGGNGAVREAIELVLSQQTDYHVLVESYLNKNTNLT